MPESIEVQNIAITDTGFNVDGSITEIGFCIKYSAKNKYGEIIDTKGYFIYDYSTKEYSSYHQAMFEVGKAKWKAGKVRKAENILNGQGSREEDLTTIFSDSSDASGYLETYDSMKNTYETAVEIASKHSVNPYEKVELELDCDEIMKKVH